MFRDIRLHGITENLVEYDAIAVGADTCKRYFFDIDPNGTTSIRLFSPGNELLLSPDGITHSGNGGSFCEYMFGIEQPLADLVKGDVINRLVMYGTHYRKDDGSLFFSETADGYISYDKIFFDGNAICNYCLFVHADRLGKTIRKQQENLIRLFGKVIKRSRAVGSGNDHQLINELFPLLDDPHAQMFLVKLVNIRHRAYRDMFQDLYFRHKKIPDDDYARLTQLAADYSIDRYQQERIRIDVMYKQPENRRIVDEYKSILVSCHRKGNINRLENARLTRLKTLSVRNKIPGALFYTLDEVLKHDRRLVEVEESDYLAETRQILEGLFLSQQRFESTINREDMILLLQYKKSAAENRDHRFEELLLDASKSCDEQIRDGADMSLLEGFSTIITYFDRFDSTCSLVNQLAFMETVRINDEMLRSLSNNRKEFNLLNAGLFYELFIEDILSNAYLGKFGRRKLMVLNDGLQSMEQKKLEAIDLLAQLKAVDEEERMYILLLELIRERVRNLYSKYSTKSDQETLKREVSEELRLKRRIKKDVSDALFDEAVTTLKKEAAYLHSILPKVIASGDASLRDDFLENSGLDRFYVEELEREYFEHNGLDMEELYRLQKGPDAVLDEFDW
jgi:uncharacterized protein (TIGR04442 family)